MGRRRSRLAIDGFIGGLKEESTCFAGASLLVEVFRQAGVGDTAERALPKKQSPKGLSPGQMVEAFVLLSALGGDCVEDVERLRQDRGLHATGSGDCPPMVGPFP